MMHNHVKTPIQDYHHHNLLSYLLHNAQISYNKTQTRKKEAKEAANN
jgi:hypothetical protein